MARRRKTMGSTAVKRSWDIKRLSRALASQGVDLRHWVSYATVASVTGDDGKANYTDPNAIVITPAGVEIDVVLEPSGYPVTCKYGMQAGLVYWGSPIRPGDQVLVTLPDGDVSMVPVAVKVVSGSSDPMPAETDGSPVFKNDRALIFAEGVPIDLRTRGGARVLLDGNGVILNNGQKGVARLDDVVRARLSGNPLALDGIVALATALLGTGLFVPTVTPPPPPPQPDFDIPGQITSASGTVKAGG